MVCVCIHGHMCVCMYTRMRYARPHVPVHMQAVTHIADAANALACVRIAPACPIGLSGPGLC